MSISKNYRKITVGDSFSNCIAYVKGAYYLKRSVKISEILLSDDPDYLDIYVISQKNSDSILWKSIQKDQILEAEYDLNFE